MTQASGEAAERGFDRWVATHDERWSFTLIYVGAALVLSTLVSLFWLVVVVAAHGLLEWFALRQRGVQGHRLLRVAWHIKVDIGLVLLALALALYFEVLLGMVGLGAVARTSAQLTARVVAWQRAIRGIVLSADDVALVARAALRRRTGDEDEAASSPTDPSEGPRSDDHTVPWAWPWPRGERAAVVFVMSMALLIVFVPVLTDHSVASAFTTVIAELRPVP